MAEYFDLNGYRHKIDLLKYQWKVEKLKGYHSWLPVVVLTNEIPEEMMAVKGRMELYPG